MKKITVLDKLLSEQIFSDEEEAKKWILLGRVIANGQRVLGAHEKIAPDAEIRVKEGYKREFVSKGALKLAGALDAFGVFPKDKVCLDCGASTGGFSDCLLSRGASLVYAVDAGHGMLAGKLMGHERVRNLERTNLSDASLLQLSPKPTLITLDLSYLSLKDAFEPAKAILGGQGEIIALVKPIFETADHEARRSGKINEVPLLDAVLSELLDFFMPRCKVRGVAPSPVRGNHGAAEFFLSLAFAGEAEPRERLDAQAAEAVEAVLQLSPFSKENA